MKPVNKQIYLLILLLGSSFCYGQSSNNYEISWYTIDGGGGTSSGGDFVLSGTIGQPDAGEMSGEGYVLTGGFWYGRGCVVDLVDLQKFTSQWLDSGEVEANFDWEVYPQPDNRVDLHDYSYLANYWMSWCPDDWPW